MKLNRQQLRDYERDGFLLLPELFSATEVAVLRARLPTLFAEDRPENIREKAGGAVRSAMALHLRDEAFAALVQDPRLVGPAHQIAGDALYVQQVKVNVKAAFGGDLFQWHYDFATHHRDDGVPAPLALNLHVFLAEVNSFNGPLYFIPGSHRRGPAPATLDSQTTGYPLWIVDSRTVSERVAEGGIFAATGPPGTALIFGDCLIHASPANISPWDRPIFSLILNPVTNAQTRFQRPDYVHHRDLTRL